MNTMPTDKTKYEYNLQPYSNNGDTTGKRNLNYYTTNLLPILKNIISKYPEITKSLLDLGCGNGRINSLTHDLFDKIHCVDPIDSLHDKFKFKNISYGKKHLHEISDKFESILMVGSMHSIWGKYGKDTIGLLKNILNSYGILMIVSDTSNNINILDSEFKVIDEFIFDDKITILKIYKYERIGV